MGFAQAVSSALSNYINFSGRAARPQYWYFILFLILGGIVTAIFDVLVLGAKEFGPTNIIFSLATFIPSLAVGVRRLHDIGRTGWWLLIAFVPIVGVILLIVWACQQGEAGSNQYGPPATA